MKVTKGQFKQLIREQVRIQIIMQLEEGFKWDMFKGAAGAAGSKVKDLYNQIKDAGRRKAVERMGQKFGEEVGKLYNQMTAEMTKYNFDANDRKVANMAIAQQLITMGSALKYKFDRGTPAVSTATPKGGAVAKSATSAAVPATTPVEEVVKGTWVCLNCNHNGSGEATVCPRCGQPNLREV